MSKEKKLVLRNPKHCQNNRVYLILYSTTLVENIYIQILESKINIFLLNSSSRWDGNFLKWMFGITTWLPYNFLFTYTLKFLKSEMSNQTCIARRIWVKGEMTISWSWFSWFPSGLMWTSTREKKFQQLARIDQTTQKIHQKTNTIKSTSEMVQFMSWPNFPVVSNLGPQDMANQKILQMRTRMM